MIQKIRCIDASAEQLAQASNTILRKSKSFAEQAYSKNILSSKNPKFNKDSIKTFYGIGDFYDKNGNIKEDAKPVFANVLKDFGLSKNATLSDFINFILKIYK